MAGVLDTARFKCFVAEALNCSIRDVEALVLGGHGDDMVPLLRHSTVGGVPLTELLPKEKLDAIVDRTREGRRRAGGAVQDRVGVLRPGGLGDRHGRELHLRPQARAPRARRCSRASTASRGSSWACPVQIGAGGVEKIIELKLDDEEKAELQKSFQSVKKTVDEVKL